MMMALALYFSILNLQIRGFNQLAPIRWFRTLKLKTSLLFYITYVCVENLGNLEFIYQDLVLTSIKSMYAHQLPNAKLILGSVIFAVQSIFTPLLLKGSEQRQIKKHFSGVSWLCF
jgi:hypothetical protein